MQGESQEKRQIQSLAVKTRTEILTVVAPIREAEGPENLRMKTVAMKEPKDRHKYKIMNKMPPRTASQGPRALLIWLFTELSQPVVRPNYQL